jgi:hypothetical protein
MGLSFVILVLFLAVWGTAQAQTGNACTRDLLKSKVDNIQSVIGSGSKSTGWASEEVLKN